MAVRATDPPLWRTIITNLDSRTLSVFDQRAKERAYALTFNGASSHVGRVAADDPEVHTAALDGDPLLAPNNRLAFCLRREKGAAALDSSAPYPWVPRFSGLVEQTEDASGDVPTTRYTAYDAWQYWYSRRLIDPLTNDPPGRNGINYAPVALSDVAQLLLAASEAADGPLLVDLSSIDSMDTALTPIKFDRGMSLGDAFDRMVESGTIEFKLNPIYDPVNRPGVLNELVIRPAIGNRQDNAIFHWDTGNRSNISNLTRIVDGTRLANKIVFYAGQGGEPVTTQTNATSIAKYGEYWMEQFLSNNYVVGLVETLAQATLRIHTDGLQAITFTPTPEIAPMPLRDYQVGDYVPVWASRNFRDPIAPDLDNPPSGTTEDPNGWLRVFAIPIEVDDNGVEQVRAILTSQDSASASEA